MLFFCRCKKKKAFSLFISVSITITITVTVSISISFSFSLSLSLSVTLSVSVLLVYQKYQKYQWYDKYPNIVPIPGSKNLERILENLGACDISFSDDEFADLDGALSEITIHGHRGCVEFDGDSMRDWNR